MLTSRWAFVVLAVVTILLLKGAWGVHLKMKESQDSLVKVHQSLQVAQKRETELTTSIDTLKTPEGIEREIRSKFNVAKSGEEVIMVVDTTQNESSTDDTGTPLGRVLGSWFFFLFK